MRLFYVLIFSIFVSLNLIAQTPPLQPGNGPGGSNYSHNGVTFSDFTSFLNSDGYWLFEPSQPVPDSADVIIFNHGYGVWNPGPYGQWIEHLVRKGNIVIFPKYQTSDAQLPDGYTDHAVIGIMDAINELITNPNRVKPRMYHLAIIGHSYGGVITSNLATNYATYGTPKPKCFMLCEPGTGGFNGGRLDSYRNMDTDYNALIVVGDDDIVVGNSFGREIMDSTAIPTSHKNYIIQYADNHGSPNIEATHNEPLCSNNNYDGGTISTIITGGYAASKQDAVDYYCYWKLADALLSCTFYGTDCNYAFGDTPEQRYMGEWSDGTPVLNLVVEPASHTNVEENNVELIVYPNPANNEIYINNNDQISGTVKIFDNLGRMIISEKINPQVNSINIEPLTSGHYTLVYNGLTTKTTHFIKQ